MDFDYYWANDDHADTKSTWMSREQYQEFFLPYQKIVANAIKKPWVFHSDGNLLPILDDLLTLGMNGLHPIQPAAMNIKEVKAKYGQSRSAFLEILISIIHSPWERPKRWIRK